MADYEVDGRRLGSVEWSSRSGSDVSLDSRAKEILGVAQILSLLGHEKVRIVSLDANGRKLERPDLDVILFGRLPIGVEEADISPQGKHEAEADNLSLSILKLLDDDPAFSRAFGNHRVVVFLSTHVVGKFEIASKKERLSIQAELEQFLRSAEHIGGGGRNGFSKRYPILESRGATWHSSPEEIPSFVVAHGANNPSLHPSIIDVVRVLDKHRASASAPEYRKIPTWIMLIIVDRWDFTRRALDEVAASNPPIEPFERCYLSDDGGRVLELLPGIKPVFVGMFTPTP